MKKLIALAVAAAVMSPLASLADNTPDTVGDVTLLGNIVASSPMWQWTVNDYPGGRLDVKPSSAVTSNNVTTYKLKGQNFIAVSGYLPSLMGVNGTNRNSLGLEDMAALVDGDGRDITNVNHTANGMIEFSITANAKNQSGKDVKGNLVLSGTELRGTRFNRSRQGANSVKGIYVFASSDPLSTAGGHCFIGAPMLAESPIKGTADNPTAGAGSATAATAFIQALAQADMRGDIRWAETPTTGNATDQVQTSSRGCGFPSIIDPAVSNPATEMVYHYMSAAHILELKPMELQFSEPVVGNWNATLNVTAYQM